MQGVCVGVCKKRSGGRWKPITEINANFPKARSGSSPIKKAYLPSARRKDLVHNNTREFSMRWNFSKCCALRILLKSIWSCSRWRGGSADEIKLPFVKSCSHFDTSLRWNFSEVSASVLTPTLKNSILRSWPGESNFSHFLSIDLNLDCFSTSHTFIWQNPK